MAEILRYNPNYAINDDGDVVPRQNLTKEEEDNLGSLSAPYVYSPEKTEAKPRPETKAVKNVEKTDRDRKKEEAAKRRRLRKARTEKS